MSTFSYTFKHSSGFGNGEIEAKTEKEAIKKVTGNLQPTDKKAEKLENLVVEVTELEQSDPES